MMKIFLTSSLILLLFCIAYTATGQKTYTISGKLTDSQSGEPIFGANVYIEETMEGTTSDENGRYKLKHAEGDYTLVVRYIGFDEVKTSIKLNKNLKIDIQPRQKVATVSEVVVTGEKENKNIDEVEMGTIVLS